MPFASPRIWKLVGVVLLAWAATIGVLWRAQGAPLDWDEVEYLNAAKLGFAANYLEEGSLGPREFIQFVKAKKHGVVAALPPGYSELGDPLLERHYHPPFTCYLLSAVSSSTNEHVIRGVLLVFALALLTVLIFGHAWLAGDSWSLPGAITVAILGIWICYFVFDSITFHGPEAVWSVLTALTLSRFIALPSRSRGLALCAALALGMVTLDPGPFLVASAAVGLIVWRRERLIVRLIVGGALVGLMVFVLWPGAILKISLLKEIAVNVYRAKTGEAYAFAIRGSVFRAMLPPLAMSVPAVGWLMLRRRATISVWGPFPLIGGIYLMAVFRYLILAKYLVPVLCPLICLVGFAVDQLPRRWFKWLPVAVCLGLTLVSPGENHASEGPDFRADIEWLGQRLTDAPALVDGAHIYSFYLGSRHSLKPLFLSQDESALSIREEGTYRKLEPSEVRGKQFVVQSLRKIFLGGPVEKTLFGNCLRVTRPTLTFYDCR